MHPLNYVTRILLISLCLPFAAGVCHAKEAPQSNSTETIEAHDARMAWWREARFGMFIHWGLYAIPAGEWNGKPVAGIGEWIMNKGRIPLEDYQPLAEKFNPTNYDPEQWAQIAADAGMKYMVITAKHHDGFCLFDTAATEWDVVDATPYGKDLLVPLSKACRKHGIKFCTYYSILDWAHPSQHINQDKLQDTVMDPSKKTEYIAYIKQQLRELLDTSDPDVLWFDGEWVPWWTEADGKDLYAYLLDLKPTLIVNNRVGKGRKGMQGFSRSDQQYAGDFGTPEQQIPATGVPGVDWESCMTMNDTWGFKKNDHNWKSAATLAENLIDIVSKGGNFLLNVGPTATGEIPEPSVERLEDIGDWMGRHSEAIYGAGASPVARPSWGRCTSKEHADGLTLYLHVLTWPENGKLFLSGQVDGEPTRASLIGSQDLLRVETKPDGLLVHMPVMRSDSIASVVRIDFKPRPNAKALEK